MKAAILIDTPENELLDMLASEKEKLAKMKMSHEVSPLENPKLITSTRKGHGSYYLYTIENHKLYLCANVSKIVDRHLESKTRSWIYAEGALHALFEDLDKDSYPDLILQGYRKLVDVKGEDLQSYKIRREYYWDDWDYRFIEKN